MKITPLLFALVMALSPAAFVVAAEEPVAKETAAEEPKGAEADLKALVEKVKTKIQGGADRTEKAFSEELAEFDKIVAKNKDDSKEVLAQVVMMKGALYLQLLDQPDKAVAIFEDIKKDYPDTKAGKAADQMIAAVKEQKAADSVQAKLKEGEIFPPFEEKDTNGKPLSIAALKGKVVLVDFWATWCPPCVAEAPNVVAAYKKYHEKGFDIVGISLDEDRSALDSFIKENDMAWPQYFDGKGWDNVLGKKYGIRSIPATFLLNGEGKIIGKNLRGEELDAAIAKAVGKN
jgi:peroxiredoxin